MIRKYYFIISVFILTVNHVYSDCVLPKVIKGAWFSLENGQNTITIFTETLLERTKQGKATCVDVKKEHNVDYTILWKNQTCYSCMKMFIRTTNVIEKIESACINIENEEASMESICEHLDHDQKLITLFSNDDYNRGRVNCKNSLEGVYTFAYEKPNQFSGKCDYPRSMIKSCQIPDKLSLSINDKFEIVYHQCEGTPSTVEVNYGCLGDWYVGKNHFFAVFNTRESRNEEKYRCFIKNDNDEHIIGVSNTAECSTLKSPRESPEILYVRSVKSKPIVPGCRFPENFTGKWIDSADVDADIFINDTHIIESYSINGKIKKIIYICRELRLSTAVMTKLTVEGCHNDYVCFEFLCKEKNLIRYRKGKPTIHHQFDRACSVPLFNDKHVIYEYYLKKNPDSTVCPFKGHYKFTQMGDVPFETRLTYDGVAPAPTKSCKDRVSDFSTSEDGKEISITKNYCPSVANSVDNKNKPDYKFKCIADWEEDKQYYLITFDEFDPIYQYRCWTYGKDANNIFLSQAIGSSCDQKQTVNSWNYTEGATVALNMQKYEHAK